MNKQIRNGLVRKEVKENFKEKRNKKYKKRIWEIKRNRK
jgi:hypothetical protein